MVVSGEQSKIYKKILYWGMYGSGKTTIVDTLYKLTFDQQKVAEQSIRIEPTGALQKIDFPSGATLYFDRGTFQSTKQKQMFWHIFTVAGQKSYIPLREKVFKGTDGIIFVVDSQTNLFEDNIESLKELKQVAKGKLIYEMPLVVMLNKQDCKDIIVEEDIKQVLKNERLWFEPANKLHVWNPIIYKTCALYNQERDIYRSFCECARRVFIYQAYGNGRAPVEDVSSKLSSLPI